MKVKQSDPFISADDSRPQPASMPDDRNGTIPKETFVKPQLISHGGVIDLTTAFGGSLTPTDRPHRF
jgi:hypothetical protein